MAFFQKFKKIISLSIFLYYYNLLNYNDIQNENYTIIDLIANNYIHFKVILQMNIYINKII